MEKKDSTCIRGKKQYHELSTQRGGVYFTTDKLRQLSTSYHDNLGLYEKEQNTLVKEVIEIAGKQFFFLKKYLEYSKLIKKPLFFIASYCPALETLNGLMAHLDVIVRYETMCELKNYCYAYLLTYIIVMHMLRFTHPYHTFAPRCIIKVTFYRTNSRNLCNF